MTKTKVSRTSCITCTSSHQHNRMSHKLWKCSHRVIPTLEIGLQKHNIPPPPKKKETMSHMKA